MAFGSWFWGFVANTFRVETAFIASGVAMLASLLLVFVFPLSNDEAPDITPARIHPVDELQGRVGASAGPIVLTIEYTVRPIQSGGFVGAVRTQDRGYGEAGDGNMRVR